MHETNGKHQSANGDHGKSSIAFKYPTFRDDFIKSARRWIDGKRIDDNAEGLWRVHDKLYDLTDFIKSHPGGSDWLTLTKGIDITEQFETHHLTSKPEKILAKYYIKDATEPRNYKLTFNDNGFYRTLKRKVNDKLKSDIDLTPASYSNLITDILVTTAFITAILAVHRDSYVLGVISSLFLSWAITAAHNFFHQMDNFRMSYFNLTFLSYREWRVTHAMSHHLYTNSIYDIEMSMLEPWQNWVPGPKSKFLSYGRWLFSPILYTVSFHFNLLLRVIELLMFRSKVFYLDDLIGFTLPVSMFILGKNNLADVILMWNFIIFGTSLIFGFVGLNAGHHHPDVTHEGDELRKSMDFGIFQMDAVIDRMDVKGSQFLVLTNFGEHTLHHLFPTLDHGVLPQIYDIFYDTCKEFETELRAYPWYKLIIGQFQQQARTKPRSLEEKFGSKKSLNK